MWHIYIIMHYRKQDEGSGSFGAFSAFPVGLEVCLVGNMHTHIYTQAEAEADWDAGYKIKKIKWSLIFCINDNNTTTLRKNIATLERRPAEGWFNLSGFKKSLPLV